MKISLLIIPNDGRKLIKEELYAIHPETEVDLRLSIIIISFIALI